MRRQMARYGHLQITDLQLIELEFQRLILTLRVATHLHTVAAGKVSAMLRISTCDNSGVTRLVVEGKLAGACVAELEKCWRATASGKSPETILVDLSSVTWVDAAGKRLLAFMHEQGIGLVASGLLAKCFIEEIEGPASEKNNKDF